MALHWLERCEKNPDVPIVFLTAKTMKEDVLKGYKAGADDYLNKPFDSEVLIDETELFYKRKSSNSLVDSKQFNTALGTSFELEASFLEI